MRTVHVGVILVVLAVGAMGAHLLPNTPGASTDVSLSDFPTLTDAKLKDRTIVDFGRNNDGTVSYSYLAAPVPASLVQDEIPQLRNETSYTTLVKAPEGADDTVILRTVIYSQPAYAQGVDGTWHYLDYATTTEHAFYSRDLTLWKAITELLVRSAYADTFSPFSGAGDGMVFRTDSASSPCTNATFTTSHNATTGSGSTNAGNTISPMSTYSTEPGVSCSAQIERGFFPFDTSSISSTATISAATLNLYTTLTADDDNDGVDYITISTSTQATHTTIANADYNDAGPATMNAASEVIDSGQRKDITSISLNAYLTFNFNAAGIAAIKKSGQTSTCSATTGITCLAVREGHDAELNPPSNGAILEVDFSSSEATGTSQDPYMDITYTVPQSVLSGGVWLGGGGGKLQVVGGKLQIL